MFNLSPEQRIREWRKFRIDLKQYDGVQCIKEVAKLWATAPLSSQHLAYDLPDTWPTAWELINDNYYDDVGVALGIFYTLYYSEIFDENSIMYNVYKNTNGIITTVTVNHYVLNYDIGSVTLKENIDIMPIFQYNSKDIIKG